MPDREIVTARLTMRPLSPDDLDEVHRVWNHPQVRRYLWDDQEVSRERAAGVLRESAANFEERGFGIWGIVDQGSEERIGFCGLRFSGDPDLVYGLLPAYWNLGLATEAARAVLRYGFERAGLQRITASADTENTASLRVMERAGMRFERCLTVEGRELISYELSRETHDLNAAPG